MLFKLIFIIIYIYGHFSHASEISCQNSECDFFANLKINDLKPNFQEALQTINLKIKRDESDGDDMKRWCCRNGNLVPTKIIKTTYIEWDLTGSTVAIKDGEMACGLFGLESCTGYRTGFVPVSHLKVGYEVVLDKEAAQLCEDHHAVCCKGTLLVAGNCLTPKEFSEVTKIWANLLPFLKETNPDYKLQDLIVALKNHGINENFKQTKPPNSKIDIGK